MSQAPPIPDFLSASYKSGTETVTIRNSFNTLLRKIQPLNSEILKAKNHAITIRRRLEDSFVLKNFEIIGSHSRGTAIRHNSDVDYFAVFSRKEAQWGDSWVQSDTLLKRVREELGNRYPLTEVGRDQQAVVVHFSGGEYAVDVVPALYEGPAKDG